MPKLPKNRKSSQTNTDIARAIAKTTSLTYSQVREALDALGDMIYAAAESEYAEDFSFAISTIGKVKFIKKNGRKAGDTYKQYCGFGENKRTEWVTIQEDEPDYLRLKFDFMPRLQELTKKSSIEKFEKDKKAIERAKRVLREKEG
jgi:hypothetical protein